MTHFTQATQIDYHQEKHQNHLHTHTYHHCSWLNHHKLSEDRFPFFFVYAPQNPILAKHIVLPSHLTASVHPYRTRQLNIQHSLTSVIQSCILLRE